MWVLFNTHHFRVKLIWENSQNLGWTASQNHLPILRPNNYSKNSGNRRAVWDVGYGGTSGYSPARVARITPETLAAAERASQKSHFNLGYNCPSSPAGVSFRDRPETVRLCVGGKRGQHAHGKHHVGGRSRETVVAIATGQTPSPRYKPPRQSLSVRIKQEHLFLITSLQSSKEMMLGRGGEIETERFGQKTLQNWGQAANATPF